MDIYIPWLALAFGGLVLAAFVVGFLAGVYSICKGLGL